MHSAKRQATKEEINKAIEEVGNGNITPGALIGGVGASILGASVTIPAEMLAASAAALVVSAPAIATTMIVVGTAALICGASMILYEYFTHGAGKSRRQEPQINQALNKAIAILQAFQKPYYIVCQGNGLFIDAQGGGVQNGTPVQLWQKNSTDAQKWRILPSGHIQSVKSGRCITVHGSFNGGGNGLVLWDKANQPSQKFYHQDNAIFIDSYTLTGEKGQGGRILLSWGNSKSADQKWNIVPA